MNRTAQEKAINALSKLEWAASYGDWTEFDILKATIMKALQPSAPQSTLPEHPHSEMLRTIREWASIASESKVMTKDDLRLTLQNISLELLKLLTLKGSSDKVYGGSCPTCGAKVEDNGFCVHRSIHCKPLRASHPPVVQEVATSGWISVTDRLPELGQTVLVWNAKEARAMIDTWAEQYEAPVSFSTQLVSIGPGWDENYDFIEVTHWQCLLEPPNERS